MKPIEHLSIVNKILLNSDLDLLEKDNAFYIRFIAHSKLIFQHFAQLYEKKKDFEQQYIFLLTQIVNAYKSRTASFKERDLQKLSQGQWFLSNKITGMSLYVDRFASNLKELNNKIPYFEELGVNFLHLMPIMDSPENESDGGYAVSDYTKVNSRFGNLNDLKRLQTTMFDKEMYLMLDIVINHTSDAHKWAQNAKKGDKKFMDFFYMYPDRNMPDQFEESMPEIFPHSSPGNFTYCEDCKKWVMTVFNHYQWDLNYTNPDVFNSMMENIFFYANLGVDILRVDAPAFIWKKLGTTCQNLPEAHIILQLMRACVDVATPGMALLGEAIVAPKEIIKYFGTPDIPECSVAYNATHMATQWDALATGDTMVLLKSQHDILQKPLGSTWINYTRCHDDIGLGFEDEAIHMAGYAPYEHRKFLKNYYSGNYESSTAIGALFAINPKTLDARISGSLASLCGLEFAINNQDSILISKSIQKILMMQAHCLFLGGIPMLYYGDEVGYTNDYSYLEDENKKSDNRWMHRPLIDWVKNNKRKETGTVEQRIFSGTQKLIKIRHALTAISDFKNLEWLHTFNKHVAILLREFEENKVYCLYNFSDQKTSLVWNIFRQNGLGSEFLYDHWTKTKLKIGANHELFFLEPFEFMILEELKF